MSALSKVKKSRDGWKIKAIDRGGSLSYVKKELNRIKTERDHYKTEFKKIKKQLDMDLQTKNYQQSVINYVS